MDDQKSQKLLQQIHDEINNIQTLDQPSIELLRDLDLDIRTLLDRSGDRGTLLHPTVVQRFEFAISHFEVSHPELATLISKFLGSLSNAGV